MEMSRTYLKVIIVERVLDKPFCDHMCHYLHDFTNGAWHTGYLVDVYVVVRWRGVDDRVKRMGRSNERYKSVRSAQYRR